MSGNAHRSDSRRYAVGLMPAGGGGAFDPLELTYKVMKSVIESHPGIPRRLPHGCRRPGHRRVGERTKGDADEVGETFSVPENCGTAAGAEMEFALSPRIAAAHVNLARSFGAYLLFREIGGSANGRASTALALAAIWETPDVPRIGPQKQPETVRPNSPNGPRLDASLDINAAPSPAPIRAEQGGFKLVIIDTPRTQLR
jgi:hypothetical protein